MMPFADKLNLTRQVAFKVNRDFELILYCCVCPTFNNPFCQCTMSEMCRQNEVF